MSIASSRLAGLLGEASPQALAQPVEVLGLATRAYHCVARFPSVGALLKEREDRLMERRQFGRACLANVRRRLALFALEQLPAGDAQVIRAALAGEDPELEALWDAPAQPRPLVAVVEEILELLSRAEDLRVATGRRRRGLLGAPRPGALDLTRATLEEVAALVYNGLTPREREVVAGRFSRPGPAAPSLADLGRELRLTRERVRQILARALERLAQEEERRRRAPLTALLERRFEASGGVLAEPAARAALRERFPGPEQLAAALARTLLETTPRFRHVEGVVWCLEPGDPGEVRAALDGLHLLLRRQGGPAPVEQLVAQYARRPGPDADAFLGGCLAADPRFRPFEAGQFGLREWERGVPGTLREALAACLRTGGRPQRCIRLLEAVNRILPPDRTAAYGEVLAVLVGDPDFVRVRSGTYALAEWDGQAERR